MPLSWSNSTPKPGSSTRPRGKEVDCIYGDLVLRNDQIVAVIARPIAKRNANMTVRNAGGCIIDLTRASQQNDQLGAFYPGGKGMNWRKIEVEVDGQPADVAKTRIEGRSIVIRALAETAADAPTAEVRYTLADGANYVAVETVLANATAKPMKIEMFDEVRADKSFDKVRESKTPLFWAYDKWFEQAYGIIRDPAGPDEMIDIESTAVKLRYATGDNASVSLAPGASQRWKRCLFPAADELGLREIANQLRKVPDSQVQLKVCDTAGKPIAAADVEVVHDKDIYARGRTDDHGQLEFQLPAGDFEARIDGAGPRFANDETQSRPPRRDASRGRLRRGHDPQRARRPDSGQSAIPRPRRHSRPVFLP